MKKKVISVEAQNDPAVSKGATVLMVLGVLLIAANLRAPLTSVGPVIAEISIYLKLSNFLAGMVTTIPLISFATLSGFAPRISRKYGMETTLLVSLIILMIGLFIRPLDGVVSLFLGAALVGIGITIGNVLMPAFIKNNFSDKIGLMTGLYAASMNLTAALAAGFSIQIGQITGQGWRGSLGVWIFLAALALLVWLPQLKRHKRTTNLQQRTEVESSVKTPIYRSKLAWSIALFMGIQSLVFYCAAAWFPKVLQSWGMSAVDSGWMLSTIQFAQLPLAFIGPIIASKMKSQVPLVWITALLMAIGILGMILFKTDFIVLWCISIGIASGLAFSLAMMFFVLRTKNGKDAAEMSGMAQSIGYLIAGCGPPLFGMIYDYTQDWSYALILLLVASLSLLVFGIIAGKERTI